MSAYVIVDIDVHDEPGLAEYRKLVPATVEKYGGRFAVRGGKFEVREGAWQPKRIVLLEVPNVESARRWYDSPEYAPLLAMRLKASKANLVIVEGLSPPSRLNRTPRDACSTPPGPNPEVARIRSLTPWARPGRLRETGEDRRAAP